MDVSRKLPTSQQIQNLRLCLFSRFYDWVIFVFNSVG